MDTRRNNANASDKRSDGSLTEQLIRKVCTTFANQLEIKFDKKFDKLNDKLNEVCNNLSMLNKSVNSNQKAIGNLEVKTSTLDQRNRMNALRFNGFAEVEGEDIVHSITTYITGTLKVNCTSNDIDYAFRVGTSRDTNKSRPVLVNFISNIKRNAVFIARKLAKNSEISIYEDLAKERYEVLLAAKRKYGKSNAWSIHGRIYVSRDNKKFPITCMEDL